MLERMCLARFNVAPKPAMTGRPSRLQRRNIMALSPLPTDRDDLRRIEANLESLQAQVNEIAVKLGVPERQLQKRPI